MVVMKIKLYKDSAGALHASFLDGLDSVSQNNSCVNGVLVVVDGFELAQGEVLRIGYELSTGEEAVDYSLMKDNHDGTYSAELDNVITHGTTGAKWELGLQIASNWVKQTDSDTGDVAYEGYRYKQNLVEKLTFKVNNAVTSSNGKYPTRGDLDALYQEAEIKIALETKNAEAIEELKETVGGAEELKEQVDKNAENITKLGNTVSVVQSEVSRIDGGLANVQGNLSYLNGKVYENTSDIEGLRSDIQNEAHFRGYLQTNAEVQALQGTPNDYAYSAESGMVWIYQNGTWVNSGKPVPDQMTPASNATPLVDGTPSVGTENAYARGDHRHPTDTTRMAASEKGVAGGVATLDASGKVPKSQLPDDIGSGGGGGGTVPEGFNPDDYVKKSGDTMTGVLEFRDGSSKWATVDKDGFYASSSGSAVKAWYTSLGIQVDHPENLNGAAYMMYYPELTKDEVFATESYVQGYALSKEGGYFKGLLYADEQTQSGRCSLEIGIDDPKEGAYLSFDFDDNSTMYEFDAIYRYISSTDKTMYLHFPTDKEGDQTFAMLSDLEGLSGGGVDETAVRTIAEEEASEALTEAKKYTDEELAHFDFIKIVSALPEEGLPNRMYLVPQGDGESPDFFVEYLWVNKGTESEPVWVWEYVGTKTVEIDLTNYYTKEEVNSGFVPKVSSTTNLDQLYGKQDTSEQAMYDVSQYANANAVVQRFGDGSVIFNNRGSSSVSPFAYGGSIGVNNETIMKHLVIYTTAAPTTSTKAYFIGQQCIDKTNQDMYVCMSMDSGVFVWKKISVE